MSLRAKLIYIVLSSVSVAFFAFGGTAVYADGADGPFIDDGAKQNAMNYSAQQAVIRCTLLGDSYFSADTVNVNYPVVRDSILAGKSWWRYDNRWEVAKMGYFDDTDDGMLNCAGDDNTNSLEGKALGVIGRLGWTNPLTAYCELTGNTTINGKACGTDNDSMPPTVLSGGNITSARNALAAKNGGSLRTLSDAGRYASDWQALQYACGIGAGVEVKASDPNVDLNGNPVPTANTLLLAVVNKDGTTSQVRFQTSRTPPEYIEAFSVGANGDGIGFRSCQEVGNDLNAYASKYAFYIQKNQGNLTETDDREDGPQEVTPVCTGGGLGFLLCPLTTLASEAIETLAESMEGFMRFSPLIGSAQGNAVLTLWRMMVGIANILMVIAFMVIIFSQATSVGLSAYGIKKMLPRIIAAAILINLSFWICALMVDITNIIGASIPGIINSASADIGKGTSLDLATAPTFGTAVIQLTLLAIVPTLGAAALGALAFVLPVLISGFLSILAIFVVLALRHVITILLIIISPLAFAAMILPNTEGLFKKWLKALYISLALYPIIMLLAYGSMLVSRIILVAAPDAPDKGGEVWIWEVLAFVVIFAWIFALKTVVSLGGGLVAKLAGKINDPTKGVIDRSRNWAKQKQQNSTFGAIMNARKNAVNTNAQRRSYERMSRGAWGAVSSAGMMGETKQLMDTQIEDANSKIHDSRVKYSLGSISKEYDAKERDLNSDRGIVALAKAAQSAAARKDQVAFDALASHAASGGADEYKYFHELLQGRPTGEFERLGDSLRVGNKDVFDRSMRYLYSTKAGELGPKNPSLVNILQRGDSSIEKGSIDREMESGNMIKMYQKVGADKHAQYSSDQAKVAAKYATDAVIKELIENPGGKHSLGDTARKAYQAEYDAMTRGSGRSNPNGEPPVPPANQDTLPGL